MTDDDQDRSRTVQWEDPMITVAAGREKAGIDLLKEIGAGELPPPPIAATLGFEFVSAEPGRVVFAFEPAEYHYNPIGSVHGGVYATLLDSAAGCAVHSMLPAGVGYTSLDLSVKYLRALGKDTGRVTCAGTVTHMGRRTALAEAQLVDPGGRLVATATSTCLLLR